MISAEWGIWPALPAPSAPRLGSAQFSFLPSTCFWFVSASRASVPGPNPPPPLPFRNPTHPLPFLPSPPPGRQVVMDVGTGSGILAVWAALAGAKRVYAIEYTDMAKHARKVVEANGVSDIVTVIQGAVEEIDLPIAAHGLEAEEGGTDLVVDIVISEWMGYFLLRESMLDSLIRARDKYLKKKTGLMLPSHCTIYVAPVSDERDRRGSVQEYNDTMGDWHEFVESTRALYGVDMR